MSELVNLTPHAVRIIRHGCDDVVIEPSGNVARLGTVELGSYLIPGPDLLRVEYVEFGHLVQPPPAIEGTRYIVSLPAALACPRGDFVVPYLEVRDDDGRIIGCRTLAKAV